MATNVKVVGTDLRQVTIKVNPGTYLTEILEQACSKLKLSDNKYLLRHKQRQLELSQTFQTSGLVAGARLELVVRANTPSVVNVALHLPSPESGLFPPHGRVSEKLPSDFTIWQIMRQFESGKATAGKSLNITARGVPQTSNGAQAGSGQLYYEMPNIIIEKRTLSTFIDFQKTLSQLGYISGGVLMRISFQITTQPLSEAMKEIEGYFKAEEEDKTPQKTENPGIEAKSATTSDLETPSSESRGSALEMPASKEAKPTPAEELQNTTDTDAMANGEKEILTGPRQVTIFSAPTSSTPAAALRADAEEDFMPDIGHAKAHQKLLKSLGENKRLLSDHELEQKAAQEEAAVAAIKCIKIKVRFPDNYSAEWTFGPQDTGVSLYDAVRAIIADSSMRFKLALPGVRTVIGDDAATTLIRGYRLSTNTLVNFLYDDSVPVGVRRQPLLKASAAGLAQEVVVPQVAVIEVEEEGLSEPVQMPKPRNNGEGSAFKKPKWLHGFGKK